MADLEKVTKGARTGGKASDERRRSAEQAGGIAVAGAALAAIPFAAEKLTGAGSKLADKAGDLTDDAKEKVTSELKDTAKDALPDSPGEMLGGGPLKKVFGGGGRSDDDDEGSKAAPGYGSGRRMPIQQSIDVALPVTEVFNHWTEYEDWPEFMHRIESAEQVDETTVSFQAKIWGISKRFEAEIVEQRPDERIEWNVTDGYAHTGVVTFHPLAENLTRVDLSLDIQPSNLIDKASRGMRFAKRAVRGDLHRFKAYAELDKERKKGSRQTIEDGNVKRARRSGSAGSSAREPEPQRLGSEARLQVVEVQVGELTVASRAHAQARTAARARSSRTTRCSTQGHRGRARRPARRPGGEGRRDRSRGRGSARPGLGDG